MMSCVCWMGLGWPSSEIMKAVFKGILSLKIRALAALMSRNLTLEFWDTSMLGCDSPFTVIQLPKRPL